MRKKQNQKSFKNMKPYSGRNSFGRNKKRFSDKENGFEENHFDKDMPQIGNSIRDIPKKIPGFIEIESRREFSKAKSDNFAKEKRSPSRSGSRFSQGESFNKEVFPKRRNDRFGEEKFGGKNGKNFREEGRERSVSDRDNFFSSNRTGSDRSKEAGSFFKTGSKSRRDGSYERISYGYNDEYRGANTQQKKYNQNDRRGNNSGQFIGEKRQAENSGRKKPFSGARSNSNRRPRGKF